MCNKCSPGDGMAGVNWADREQREDGIREVDTLSG